MKGGDTVHDRFNHVEKEKNTGMEFITPSIHYVCLNEECRDRENVHTMLEFISEGFDESLDIDLDTILLNKSYSEKKDPLIETPKACHYTLDEAASPASFVSEHKHYKTHEQVTLQDQRDMNLVVKNLDTGELVLLDGEDEIADPPFGSWEVQRQIDSISAGVKGDSNAIRGGSKVKRDVTPLGTRVAAWLFGVTIRVDETEHVQQSRQSLEGKAPLHLSIHDMNSKLNGATNINTVCDQP
jgi:hypothetical protein